MDFLNLGKVVGLSAYELAVKQGFSGSLDEWLESLRYDHSEEFEQFKNNLLAASNKFDEDKEIIESDVVSIRNMITTALTDIDTRKTGALTDINTAKETATQAVNTAKETAVDDVTEAGRTAVGDITAKSGEAQRAITTAMDNLAAALSSAIEEISTAGTTWEQRIAQVGLLTKEEMEEASDEQLEAFGTQAEAKTAEELAKISTDEIVQDVTVLKEDVTRLTLELVDHDGRIHQLEREVGQIEEENLEWDKIIADISSGYGRDYFAIGDQLMLDYNYNGSTYQCPHNIVDHHNAIILNDAQEEVEVPSMCVEWEYTIPNGLAYDPDEAMYCVLEGGMAAGTYHFTCAGDSWSTGDNGKTFQFTVTSPLTAGMHLKPQKAYNAKFDGTKMLVYADGKSFTALYSYTITEGNGGIDLGTLGSGNLNHYHRIFLGYNRWSQSLYRQWLNAEGTGWWIAQNPFDRAPSNIASLGGFLSNLSDDVRAILKPTKHQTYRNTVTDDGGIDVTWDKVFLASLANWNCESNQSIQYPDNGAEGSAFEYYKKLAEDVENLSAKKSFKWVSTYPILIRYALNAKQTAQYVFCRSAFRSDGRYVLNVNTSGSVNLNYGGNGNRCRPAFEICGNLPSHASAE